MTSQVLYWAAQVRVSLPGYNQGQDFGLVKTVCQCMQMVVLTGSLMSSFADRLKTSLD